MGAEKGKEICHRNLQREQTGFSEFLLSMLLHSKKDLSLNPQVGLLCAVCIFSPCLSEFSLCTLASIKI